MMRKIGQLKKDNQGFTLVELMIVVAIIGILAAIAIPQFAAYRTRGFNSSGLSDVRNLNTSEAAYFSDWQVFGYTAAAQVAAAAPADGGGAMITGPSSATDLITSNDANSNPHSLQVPLGNAVMLWASTGGTLSNFVAEGKHQQADTLYAVDSDTTAIFFCQDPGGVGAALAAAPINVTANDDYTAAVVACPAPVNAGGTNWAAR